MNRRTVLGALTGALLAAPLAAGAQRVGSVPTVGVLTPGMASSPLARPSNEAFERGLHEHGWVPGQSIRIEYRYADGKPGRVNALAAEFVRMRVDLIIARSSAVALAAKGATRTIPIVMAGSPWIQCVSDSCRIWRSRAGT
jgi:putative ABC transport system substrate-binding protein